MMKRAIVTGATGFLGGHLCERLVREGWTVVATVRKPDKREASRLRELGVELRAATMEDPDALTAAMRGADVCFHAAGLANYVSSDEAFWDTNARGTTRAIHAARAAGVRRLVYVSTESVTLRNGDRVDEPESEPLPASPMDAYSASKADAELQVGRANGPDLETVSVRAPWIWGARDRAVMRGVIGSIVLGRFALVGDGTNRVTTCHAQNVAAALILAAEHAAAPGRTFHVADDGRPTFREFLGALCEASGVAYPTLRLPYWLAYGLAAAGELGRSIGLPMPTVATRPYVIHAGRTWVLDDTQIRAVLGYHPVVTREEGMAGIREWVRESGGIEAALGLRVRGGSVRR